jgi:hypothetical protein
VRIETIINIDSIDNELGNSVSSHHPVLHSWIITLVPYFRILLHDLGEQMTKDDFELVKFFCNDVNITRMRLSSAQTPQELFLLMEEVGLIHGTNLTFLEQIFRRMHRNDLLSIIGASQTGK